MKKTVSGKEESVASGNGRSTADIVPAQRPAQNRTAVPKTSAVERITPPQKRFFEEKPIPQETEPAEPAPARRPRPHFRWFRFRRRAAVVGGVLLLGFGAVAWGANAFFARAEVNIKFKQVPWDYQGTFIAAKTASRVNTATFTLPAEVFTDEKNLTQLFPASGRAQVSVKATGRITIWNAYSSEAQKLVATTRFETPDGKIFRLDQAVTVPGAKIEDGKIVPSSIEASVTADKAGADYNGGAVERMTVPGFKGTPKYDGFFGSLPGGTKGGFAGERPVPTEADITAAKQKLTHVLTASLENSMTSKRSADLAVVGGAWKVSVTRMSVNTTTDEQGNFSVFGEATFTAIGFREGDLKESLLALAAKDHPDAAFRAFEVSYGALAPDFAKGELRLPVNVKATLVPRFSADDFKMSVAGKNVRDVQTAVLALPGLSEGAVSVWPRFRSSVPTETDRIRVVVE